MALPTSFDHKIHSSLQSLLCQLTSKQAQANPRWFPLEPADVTQIYLNKNKGARSWHIWHSRWKSLIQFPQKYCYNICFNNDDFYTCNFSDLLKKCEGVEVLSLSLENAFWSKFIKLTDIFGSLARICCKKLAKLSLVQFKISCKEFDRILVCICDVKFVIFKDCCIQVNDKKQKFDRSSICKRIVLENPYNFEFKFWTHDQNFKYFCRKLSVSPLSKSLTEITISPKIYCYALSELIQMNNLGHITFSHC
ncbi:unnamed protein product [Moneuplotes crassus]|uniref:Uncharacterized protein n=1 Tax=Euplotes crassus TaxID=5936 RepID=A0AAD2D378_EUPCR|nr:unnamed protein product [Moneuplotes crassus]